MKTIILFTLLSLVLLAIPAVVFGGDVTNAEEIVWVDLGMDSAEAPDVRCEYVSVQEASVPGADFPANRFVKSALATNYTASINEKLYAQDYTAKRTWERVQWSTVRLPWGSNFQ